MQNVGLDEFRVLINPINLLFGTKAVPVTTSSAEHNKLTRDGVNINSLSVILWHQRLFNVSAETHKQYMR